MSEHLDILTSISGQKITSVQDWERFRRPEILTLFKDFVYGDLPYENPDKLEFHIVRTGKNWKDSNATFKQIDININDYHFPAYLFVPEKVNTPIPTFLTIMNNKRSLAYDFDETIDYEHLPIRKIVERGYAVIVMPTYTVSPDWMYHSEFKQGVFNAMQPDSSKRTSRSWATLAGWAFGANLVYKYIETDSDLDHENVAAIGFSRDGKAALWAAATNPKIKMVISNSSGTGGAAYTRGKKGEHIVDINISDWFCDNYRNYNEREEMLPVDQHMLLATIAPRPLYIKSDVLDEWSDPEAELLSAKLASSVYELYGLKGLVCDEKAEVAKAYHDGMIAYHVSPIDHSLTTSDWGYYMDFADKHLKVDKQANY